MDNQQSAELICQKIMDDAQRQVDSIIQKARQNAGLRIKLASNEANKYLEEREKEGKGKTADIRKKALSTVALETRRIITKAQEELIDYVLKQLKTEGKNFRSKTKYPQWLKSIIIEGLLNIAQNQVKIVASMLDSKIIEKDFITGIKDELKKKHNLDIDMETVFEKDNQDAGVCVESGDERIIFRNTFLARIERQKESLRTLIFKEIFSNA